MNILRLNPITKNNQAILLPATAIHGDGTSVYKLTLDPESKSVGTIAIAKVTLGKVDDVSAEVLAGLSLGDVVIATGWHALSVGQKVRIALSEKAE